LVFQPLVTILRKDKPVGGIVHHADGVAAGQL
jgi:hypothetical protein